MTMPDERTRAVLQTRAFLLELMDSEASPGLPDSVRREARALLRHFPGSGDLLLAHHALPERFGKPAEAARNKE